MIYVTAIGAFAILAVAAALGAAGWLEAYFWNMLNDKDHTYPYFTEVLGCAILTVLFLLASYGVGLWIL